MTDANANAALLSDLSARIQSVAFSSCDEILTMTRVKLVNTDEYIYSTFQAGAVRVEIAAIFGGHHGTEHRVVLTTGAGEVLEVERRHACAALRSAFLKHLIAVRASILERLPVEVAAAA